MRPKRGNSGLFLMIFTGIILAAGAAQTAYGAGNGQYYAETKAKTTAEVTAKTKAATTAEAASENTAKTTKKSETEQGTETAKKNNALQVRSSALRHWNIGDTVTRKIAGKAYRFRCIDQNYADHMDHHRKDALFLCDEVIPANTGSRYEFETPENSSHDYVYYPGPIVCFGSSADYKYSAVRSWLEASAQDFTDAVMVNTGVERAYMGETGVELWEQFPENELTARYLGSQKMVDLLFVLSVDEAYRYRDWLWKFDGSKKRNPETQVSEFCKGYWLRTPCRSAEGSQIYIVDLIQGNIRPEAVRTGLQTESREEDKMTKSDKEASVTGTTGVRPAFVLPQL